MLKENNATESDLVLLTLVVNEKEMRNQQVAKTASVNTFNILDLFVTRAYANNDLQEKCTKLAKDAYDCTKDVLGITDVGLLYAYKTMTKEAIKQIFISLVKSYSGKVCIAIAVAQFIWCLHGKGYF